MKTAISHEYNYSQQPGSEQRNATIVVYHLGRAVTVAASEVSFLEGVGNYTFICTRHNRYLLAKCLHTVQESLGGDFVRVHKSYSVNRYQIRLRWVDRLLMQCGREVPIARRRLAFTHEALSASVMYSAGY